MLTEELIDKKLEYYGNKRHGAKVNIETVAKILKEIKEVYEKQAECNEREFYRIRESFEKINNAFTLLSLEYCKEKFSNG